jgi:hypothetical protein
VTSSFLAEGFSAFVRVWFAHTRSVPEVDENGACRDAEQRSLEFVEHVGQQYIPTNRAGRAGLTTLANALYPTNANGSIVAPDDDQRQSCSIPGLQDHIA